MNEYTLILIDANDNTSFRFGTADELHEVAAKYEAAAPGQYLYNVMLTVNVDWNAYGLNYAEMVA